MTEQFQVGDLVERIGGNHACMQIGDRATVKRISSLDQLYLDNFAGDGGFAQHDPCKFKLISRGQSMKKIAPVVQQTQVPIIVPASKVRKITFLYDNGKTFTTTRVTHLDTNTIDIRGVKCIQYATKSGAVFVYRDDLAAITFVCEDGYQTVQKLMPHVMIDNGVARMYKTITKTKGENK